MTASWYRETRVSQPFGGFNPQLDRSPSRNLEILRSSECDNFRRPLQPERADNRTTEALRSTDSATRARDGSSDRCVRLGNLCSLPLALGRTPVISEGRSGQRTPASIVDEAIVPVPPKLTGRDATTCAGNGPLAVWDETTPLIGSAIGILNPNVSTSAVAELGDDRPAHAEHNLPGWLTNQSADWVKAVAMSVLLQDAACQQASSNG